MANVSIDDAAASDANAAGEHDMLVAQVREAVANATPLSIRGGGTKSWYGHRVEGIKLDVRACAGVVDYEPSELVIVARAGTPLQDVEALLAKHGQMLAFEPPHFAPTQCGPQFAAQSSPRSASPVPGGAAHDSAPAAGISSTLAGNSFCATLGGCIAAGLSGPRRMAAGAARDFVLGARVIDGRGQHLSFGGRVMKNVAGYDVSRALVGSLGTLGVITEVSLKVLPRPVQTATLAFALSEQAALDKLNQWGGLPLAITASAWRPDRTGARNGRLMVRLEGSESAVLSGIRRLGGLDVDQREAAAYWLGLREQTEAFFASRPPEIPLWRIALPSIAPPLDASVLGFEDQLIEWGGALRWIAARADGTSIRQAATALGGHATLWRGSDPMKAQYGVFTPLSAPLMAIHRRLKAEFDPDRLFNRGRIYADW